MARVHHVKHAQPRYATKPVLGEDGEQAVRVTGRTTRRTGRQVKVRVTERDLTRPLPNRKCENCGREIKPGDPYKWVQPKTGPYGGRKRFRCGHCPSWQVWELSQSLSAQLAKVSADFWHDADFAESVDDVESALGNAAAAVRDIAEEKRESAANIEEGFGHPTSQSEELADTADQLDSWADEIESASVPDLPEPEDDAEEDEDARQERLDGWREELQGELTIVDESPV